MADLATLLALAEALPEAEVQECYQPYAIFVQETNDLWVAAFNDAPMLTSKGLPQETIDNLTLWSQLLQGAQSEVKSVASESKESQKQWNIQYPKGVELRDNILESEEFAYYNDPVLTELLEQVKEGNDYADTIEDLHIMANIGRENPDPLTATGFDLTLLDDADAVADSLTQLRSLINGNRYHSTESMLKRGQIYTLAKRDVDEVHRVGKFVFRKDSEHVKLYGSYYTRKRKAKYKKEKKAEQSDSGNE